MFRPVIRLSSKRLFSITPRRSNLVSELYIQQIKAFKPTALSAKEIDSAVKAFQLPAKPSIPATEIAAEALAEYEASEVETASTPSSSGAAPVEEDWFVFEEEAEEHH
ncbi:F1F0-ATPase complex, subunit H [Scheffersomyces xylosifermentans]|uniref:F1F0-ATPase complex, subunit H n=1 Tax=Scheffersomyces xylosifermentans TaxID=1304137 RepID=UPI00315C4F0F